jgi:hypothetical protein
VIRLGENSPNEGLFTLGSILISHIFGLFFTVKVTYAIIFDKK